MQQKSVARNFLRNRRRLRLLAMLRKQIETTPFFFFSHTIDTRRVAATSIFVYNFIHHKVANNSKNIQQWKLTTEKQTKY